MAISAFAGTNPVDELMASVFSVTQEQAGSLNAGCSRLFGERSGKSVGREDRAVNGLVDYWD